MKKIIIFIAILFSFTIVKAYENDYFSIEIPSNYKITNESNNTYKWEKDNNYIAISLSDNSKNKYNIKYYSQEDINKQQYYIEDKINEKLSNYNLKASISSMQKKNIEDIYFLEYDLYLPSKEAIGYDTYQKGRIYSLNNYLVTIIYNTDQKLNEEDYNNVINTFKIKDKSIDTTIKDLIIAAIIIGTILGIIGYLVSLRKKKH